MNFALFLFVASCAGISFAQEDTWHKMMHLGANRLVARSCLDHLKQGQYEDGYYWLFDDSNKRYVAFCDMSSEPGSAWTLVMSWSRSFKDLPQFKGKAFSQDAPINEYSPNFSSYRQSLARMKSLRARSKYWRATCNLETMKQLTYRDYLRGKFSEFDVMSWLGHGTCELVDFVNIRGHAAVGGATAQFWQWENTYTLHINSPSKNCDFKPNKGASPSEDNFGFYGNFGTAFGCTASSSSTTNWWFGGSLSDP